MLLGLISPAIAHNDANDGDAMHDESDGGDAMQPDLDPITPEMP